MFKIFSDDKKFLTYNKEIIHVFKYNIKEKLIISEYSQEIKSIKIELIKYKNKEVLIVITNSLDIFLLDILTMDIIGKLNNKLFKKDFNETSYYDDELINIIQINKNEILISQYKYIYIFNLNNFNLKFKINFENEISYILNLNDGSIIIFDNNNCKRFSLKTYESMGIFCYNKIKEEENLTSKNRTKELYKTHVFIPNEEIYQKRVKLSYNIKNGILISENKIILKFNSFFARENCYEMYQMKI